MKLKIAVFEKQSFGGNENLNLLNQKTKLQNITT